MKILHTADWHIGKRLHKHDLSKDFELFIDWLVELVKTKGIDVVLVSGDIFDLANPSSESRTAYFQTLLKLNQLKCKIILTGGNHDSPAVLNGPKELLEVMDIYVIGRLPSDMKECLIPVKNKEGKIEVVIAAIPYLRDPDLRQATEDHSYENREEAIRQGIAKVFKNTANTCKELYPNVPALAMGHLFASGVATSDSERDIQIGNLASFSASEFGDYFDYVALGHIHRPQQVEASIPIHYSGSPLPFSFSEKEDQKRVMIIDTEGFEIENVEIPLFRELKKISGALEELQLALAALQPRGTLDVLLELELIEEHYNPSHIIDLDRLVQEFTLEGAEIVKHRATDVNRVQGTSQLFESSEQLEDLKPTDVFEKLLEREAFDEETNRLAKEAFDEILEEVQNSEES